MDIKVAKNLKKGSPLAFKENTICVYGPSGSGKTTELVKYLQESGKSCVWLDIDGNNAPVVNAGSKVLELMNYIKLRNRIDRVFVKEFFNRAMDTPSISVCVRHGFIDCGQCRNTGGDNLVVKFDDWADYDLVIVDSITVAIDSFVLFAIKDYEEHIKQGGRPDPRRIWSEVNLMAKTMVHFIREIHPNVIVISHPIDVRLDYEKAIQKANHPTRAGKELVEPYYFPCLGSAPFSKKAPKSLSRIIYIGEDGKLTTNAKTPYFANTRQQIKSTTVAGALKEILD